MPNDTTTALINRVKNIILKPKEEWAVIDGETTTVKNLYLNYAVILAAIPAVCNFIGNVFFGYGYGKMVVHPSIPQALVISLLGYGFTLLSAAITALIINFLAPSFDGQKNQEQAFKVAIYSSTAAWLCGIFMLVPVLSFLGLLGLYSLYLLYCGLPIVMKAP
jgi:hypothetical protein